ncbi:glycosyltransferase involved in cell wall biosynthesis [Rhodopirellula rubra]|uniref:Glycosyltransferase involved in cell wall biosynthesis n=1 Tax=Aporhodopirellula rubra TaxID=980271 RepID=A0A7W5DZ36_9BACT|nr:glycosyltransferase family 4 protein [Aporhodopirellula rubra]MBB3206832.1 glycosyltransferase involved in cell wall biosynthesis [Aporhodopirellula rubra]
MKIVYLTAGAAGMYCGSCMHDNSLAKAMRMLGDDVLLQPVYTPIRTDEVDIASDQVFLGGIQVYLLQQIPLMRWVPRFMRSWMDRPGIISAATRRAVGTDPAKLGDLTLSMLRGSHGRQASEIERLVQWLETEIRPDAIIFSNLLIGGMVPVIAERLPQTKIVVVLQGDDLFLDQLPGEVRSEAISLCKNLAAEVDTFVTYSRFYRDKMSELFEIPESKFDIHPLSIDLKPFRESTPTTESAGATGVEFPHAKSPDEFRVGFFARIAPEKGLHVLAEAFERLSRDSANSHITLHAAGWLGEHHRSYLDKILSKISNAGLADRFHYHGSPSLAEKVSLMQSFDLLSVPSPYEDPKGLFLLEAMASGVPVLQPAHGAFVELIEATQGGECFPPEDIDALSHQIVALSQDRERLMKFTSVSNRLLDQNHSIEAAAIRMRATCGR